MASCSLCNSLGSIKIQYNIDLAQEHAGTHLQQLKIIADGVSMDQVFEQCFPSFATANVRAGSKTSSRKNLFALCHSLFDGHSQTSVICETCDDEIKLVNPKKLIAHACYHLQLDMYECRHCARDFKSMNALSNHMLAEHQLRTTTLRHYRNKTNDFVGEISAMIKTCFGGRKEAAHADEVTTRRTKISMVRARAKGSHLTVERHLFCYRLVRKKVDRNGKVQCRFCSKGIKATVGRQIQCSRVREHAYRHLPTPVYRCRICTETYFGRSELCLHLRDVHALPLLERNYECLADRYHSDVMAILNKCYGNDNELGKESQFRNLSESNLCRKTGRSELTALRQLLCYRLIRKRASADRLVQCGLCSKRISAKQANTNAILSERVMQHALLHLGKSLYQCNKCSNTYATVYGVTMHLKAKHDLPRTATYYQCLGDQFHDDIVDILHKCYANEGDEEDGFEASTSVKREPSEFTSAAPTKLTIERQTLCGQLIREYSDREDNTIQCRLCGKRISVKCATGVSTDNAMRHVLVHLDALLYRCKICSEKFPTRSGVTQHIRRNHALPVANNYVCLGDQFHTAIMEMLRKCYNEGVPNEDKTPIERRTGAESRLRVHESKQTAERQLVCHRLCHKFADSDGRIECLLCKKRIAAKSGGSYRANAVMQHVLTHSKILIYRCSICSERHPNSVSIYRHLKKAHALPMANNYECLGDEYHSEIVNVLRECYGVL